MAATTIALSAGNAQVGYPSTALPVALAVLVTDSSVPPLPTSGVTVNWKVGAGGGSMSAATSVTNASGIAVSTWTLGVQAGTPQVATADVAGLAGTPVAFTALCGLVSVQDVLSYFRIQTQVEVVNGLLAQLIGEAQAEIEFNCGKCLTRQAVTWYDDATSLRIGEAVINLILKYLPIDPTTVVVTNAIGVVALPSTYVIRLDKGLIMSLPVNAGSFVGGPWSAFDTGPYTIACVAGFGTSPTYAGRELPAIQRAIKDYVGFLFQQRDIGASTLRAAGTSITYVIDPITGLPDRVSRAIRKLRGPVVTSP
jgi:hypothetical protein